MKLRIRGNSIRLRLTQSEVNQFLNQGSISDSIQFGLEPENELKYQLKIAICDHLQANYDQHQITVLVPEQQGLVWANTQEVSMEHLSTNGQDEQLKILVEKDFQCLVVRSGGEDQDTFPNPHAK